MANEVTRRATGLSALGFWVLWAAMTLGVWAAHEPRVPYTFSTASMVVVFLGVAALGMWAATGRIALVPILFAGAGALLAAPLPDFALNLVPREFWIRWPAPSTLEIVASWPIYALGVPLLVVLAVGAIVVVTRQHRPASVRELCGVALLVLGGVYAVAILVLMLRIGFAPYLPSEASRYFAGDVYWWSGFPVIGLGAAIALSWWVGALQPWLLRRLWWRAHRTSAST